MKIPIVAILIAAAAIGSVVASAFPTCAREEPPHYDLLFAFNAEKSVSIEVTPHDTFHVVTRDGGTQYDVRGKVIPGGKGLQAIIQTAKITTTPVLGPNDSVANASTKLATTNTVLLMPGGKPAPVGGSDGDQFSVSLSPAKTE